SIAGGQYMPDKYLRSREQKQWRTDLFKFRAFKVAVKKMLDALAEPPEHPGLTREEYEKTKVTEKEQEAIALKQFGNPNLAKLLVEVHRSPEAMGAFEFDNFWKRFTHSDLPFTESERNMMSKHPLLGRVMEREYYDFKKARKALELEPEKEDLSDAITRIMKDRNLDPETEPPPPDIKEAIRLIVDKGRALEEGSAGLSGVEGLKFLDA